MLPTSAVIQSSSSSSFRWKLFGQSLVERNIRLLNQAGVSVVYLDLNDADMVFYENNIKKHLVEITGTEIIAGRPVEKNYLQIPANQFVLFNAFSKFEENFLLINGVYQPVKKPNQYRIEDTTDFNNARKMAIEVIRTGSGGKLAQTINKKISIPLSLLFSRFRVLPNVITIINFFIAVIAVSFLFSSQRSFEAIGGILVQLCSIIDGCDGEVARMTTRFSKLGGLLDTISDQLLALALIVVAMVKVYLNCSTSTFVIVMISVVAGVGTMVGIIIYFMQHYTESMSFASFDRDFLQVLPRNDYLVKSMIYLQYLARKELYSMMVCLFCLFNALHYYMIFFAVVAVSGSFLVISITLKYLPGMKKIRN